MAKASGVTVHELGGFEVEVYDRDVYWISHQFDFDADADLVDLQR
jgi:hypothetical protein